MNAMNTRIASTLLALAAVMLSAGVQADESASGDLVITATPVDPQVLAQQEQQLRRNLHQMRQIIEQEAAQSAANARNSTGPIYVNTADSPSLGALREQLARSMERLEDRCFGLEAKAENGNVIVICGDNAGTAENANIRNSADTTVVLPQQPTPSSAASEEGKP